MIVSARAKLEATPAPHGVAKTRRGVWPMDVIALGAMWAMVAAMFGLFGVTCFILAQTLVSALAELIQRRVRPMTALLVVSAIAACGAPLIEAVLGPHRPILGQVIAILLLGAPGVVLHRIAAHLRGRDRARNTRLLALGPLLVAMVVGGAVAGMGGAAAALAMGMLAVPFALLLEPGPRAASRFNVAAHALGILAAAIVACAATDAVLLFARGPVGLAALGIGPVAGVVALRVHAPAALARLKVTRSTGFVPAVTGAVPAEQ